MATWAKYAFGALSVLITLIAYIGYIRKTVKVGGIEPHPFSWFLWGCASAVAFLVQLARGAGPGSWVTFLTALACFVIWRITLRMNDWTFSRFDRACLIQGLGALVAYGIALLLALSLTLLAGAATAVDVFGYGPTIKKAWERPWSDDARSFFLNGLKFLPALLALRPWRIATSVYPFTILIVNVGVAALIMERRWQLQRRGCRSSSISEGSM
jgi:hypothetical protein